MKIKIAHLASFTGNIGDIANHESFYYNFKKALGCDIEITKLEIRDYYLIWNNKKFDNDFIDLVNQHDLFIIGGGNLFELCWDYSETGTTVNLSNEQLDMITTPILINAIGLDVNKGVNKENIKKFSDFIAKLQEKDSFFTVRNEGSFDIVKKFFPQYEEYILKTMDNGFYLSDIIKDKKNKKKYIGINIAKDMADIRYENIPYECFIEEICKVIEKICNETDYKIMMLPHIYSDFEAIMDIMESLDNQLVRTRLSIAPLIHGLELDTFNYYRQCKAIYAMRFHANVCAISLNIPTVPILNYPKHIELYDDLGYKERVIDTNNKNFVSKLNAYTEKIISNDFYNIDAEEYIKNSKEVYYKKIKEWWNCRSGFPCS